MRAPTPSSLTDAQEIVLIVSLFFSAALSILGSSCIIYIVVTRRKYVNTYNRLILAMSCCDVINSIFLPLSTVLVPSSSDRLLASGNDTTCSAAGFFTQFGFSVAFYNGMLSLYYLLTIRMGIPQECVSKRYEPIMHAVAIGYPLITAVIGLGLGVYSELELGFGCWVSDYPEGCESDPNLSCSSEEIGWVFAGIPVLFIMIFIAVCNISIYCKLRHLQGRISRYRLGRDNNSAQNKRTRAVAVQGFLYVAAFFNSFLWAVILRVVEMMAYKRDGESSIFIILLLTSICLPLQGFWNLFIYARPRYLRIREQSLEETRARALYAALFGDQALGESSRVSDLLRSVLTLRWPVGSTSRVNNSGTQAGAGEAAPGSGEGTTKKLESDSEEQSGGENSEEEKDPTRPSSKQSEQPRREPEKPKSYSFFLLTSVNRAMAMVEAVEEGRAERRRERKARCLKSSCVLIVLGAVVGILVWLLMPKSMGSVTNEMLVSMEPDLVDKCTKEKVRQWEGHQACHELCERAYCCFLNDWKGGNCLKDGKMREICSRYKNTCGVLTNKGKEEYAARQRTRRRHLK